MEGNKQPSEKSLFCVNECRYPIEESGIFYSQKYHAVSLSGGKDNGKKIKMESISLKMQKEPEASSKLFP